MLAIYDGRRMWHAWERSEMRAGLWWEHSKERNNWEDLCIDSRMVLKYCSERTRMRGVDTTRLVQGESCWRVLVNKAVALLGGVKFRRFGRRRLPLNR